MYIHQYLLDILEDITVTNKVLVIYGPRQIGKTTLLRKLLEKKQNYLLTNGEDIEVQHYLSSQSIETLKAFIGNKQLLVIDEAQKVPHIGLNLKLLVDNIPGIQIIATGSSAFDLANHLGEPLTGRKLTFRMFPLSQIELKTLENPAETRAHLEERLIYGSYPEIILMNDNNQRKDYLRELISSYLYKDILEIEGIRKSNTISKILQLLAFQIGKDVSLTELGQQVGLNKATVDRYLDLLEKTFIIVRLTSFSRNLRKEISKGSRYYFYDTGVRNAIVNQFNPLSLRDDIGALWENYVLMERVKKQEYYKLYSNNYFWRTYSQQEIDWIEERDGQLFGYEIKWKEHKVKEPSEWRKAYTNAHFEVINQDNYLSFIT